MLLLLRFYVFLRFFQNPKKRDVLRFFAVFHTFSRTMIQATLIILMMMMKTDGQTDDGRLTVVLRFAD